MRMRKMRNLEPRMERCAAYRIDQPTATTGNWRSLMPECTALWVEVGCGKGKFTAETAFKLHNIGTTQLLFGLCKNMTQVPGVSGIILDAGAEQNLTAGMLGNYDKSHTFINVLNLSDEATGNFVLTRVK